MAQRRTLLNHPLVHRIHRAVEQYQLLKREDDNVVIIALSGGADSTALLWGLTLLGYKCIAAHCNFHLRGDESNRDESFVRKLCMQLQVPLECTSFDTYCYVAQHKGVSIEMAARELRYHFFEDLYTRHQAQCIALGHHLEDNVEQLLINISQGAGIRGLRAMRPSRNEGKYIRPLIDIPPHIIHDFLQTAGQDFVTDSTNADTSIRRNFVRHTLRPLFDQLNPSFDTAVASTIHRLRDLELIYDDYITRTLPERTSLRLEIAWLCQQIAPTTILYNYFAPIDCNRHTLEQIIIDCTQREHLSSYACYQGRCGIIERYRGYLVGTTSETQTRLLEVSAYNHLLPDCKLWASGATLTHPLGTFSLAVHNISDKPLPPTTSLTHYHYIVDYDKLIADSPALQLTACTDPDQSVSPLGLSGSKSMSKLLRDAKLLPSRRSATPLLVDTRTNKSLWIVGICRSQDYLADPATRRWVDICFSPTTPLFPCRYN